MRIILLVSVSGMVLGLAAMLRPPEYDEAYSIFLTAGDPRPAWPVGVFTAGAARHFYAGTSSFWQIIRDLQAGDVHPPLYFWALELWRGAFGPSWIAARLLSVLLSLAALWAVAGVAVLIDIPALPAMALTLCSYGFAYTGIIARDFALAQLLDLVGVWLALIAARRQDWRCALAGGLALGAASFTNYLAIFIAGPLLIWLALGRANWRQAAAAGAGLMVFLPADYAIYAAQHATRAAQFERFSPLHALNLLVRDGGAAVFGGLPLYAGKAGALVAALLGLLLIACFISVLRRGHAYRGLLAALALAPPAGLLALGLVFNTTPIEIRYLAFSLPYLALLLAACLPMRLMASYGLAGAAGVLGLMVAPSTMQPQGLAARDAIAVPGALILVPFGNDGVGIPGPVIAALPDQARVELFQKAEPPPLVGAPEIILADIAIDNQSRVTTPGLEAALAAMPCLTARANTPYVSVYSNRCADQQH